MHHKTIGPALLVLSIVITISVSVHIEDKNSIDPVNRLASTSHFITYALAQKLGALNEGKNFVFSPFSLTQLLHMLYLGAGGETKQELGQLLNIKLTFDNDDDLLKAVDDALHVFSSENQVNITLNTASRVLVAENFDIEPDYVDVCKNFEANIENIVINADNAASNAKLVNDWASKQTNGKITQVVEEDIFNPQLRLLLLNAVYYLAEWKTKFDRHTTRKGDWQLNESDTKPVNFMSLDNYDVGYHRHEHAEFVQLNYLNDHYSMILMLPTLETDSYKPDSGLAQIEPAEWGRILRSLDSNQERVIVGLPRFEIKQSINVKRLLSTLAPSVFAPGANLSAISSTEGLYVDAMVQKSFIRVNEEGTEAAAVTHVSISAVSWTPSKSVNFNRPFMFIIRHRPTDTLLFTGRVADPEYNLSEQELAVHAQMEANRKALFEE